MACNVCDADDKITKALECVIASLLCRSQFYQELTNEYSSHLKQAHGLSHDAAFMKSVSAQTKALRKLADDLEDQAQPMLALSKELDRRSGR